MENIELIKLNRYMKKTFSFFSLVLFFSAITINASAQKSQVTVFDGKTWGAAESYHLCLNSSLFGIEGTVSIIEKYVRENLL